MWIENDKCYVENSIKSPWIRMNRVLNSKRTEEMEKRIKISRDCKWRTHSSIRIEHSCSSHISIRFSKGKGHVDWAAIQEKSIECDFLFLSCSRQHPLFIFIHFNDTKYKWMWSTLPQHIFIKEIRNMFELYRTVRGIFCPSIHLTQIELCPCYNKVLPL